ncbi:MAG: MBL fold metallo-hydrolase [Firmicutes bacterium]|nr:MBL fold metallo-hydrolase [Bacillota bacterium]
MLTELAKDIYRIEVPLPKNPMKLLNSYLIKGKDRNLIIDTGFNRPECREAVQSAFDELHISRDNTDIFITHLHADHSGQVFFLKNENNKAIAEPREAAVINRLHDDTYWDHIYEEFRKAGLKMEKDEAIATHPGVNWRPDDTVNFTHIQDGDILSIGDYNLRCIVTPGHSPGHTCLYDDEKQILFCGDMILGDITPNLCYELYLDDPLTDYVNSLNIIDKLPIKTIYVGHRNMLQDVYGRVASLRVHHTLRCREALDVLKRRGPQDSWDAAANMTWDISAKNWEAFPPSQKWFATGEADAHMIFLYHNGKVSMHYNDDGVKIYEYVDDNIDGLI